MGGVRCGFVSLYSRFRSLNVAGMQRQAEASLLVRSLLLSFTWRLSDHLPRCEASALWPSVKHKGRSLLNKALLSDHVTSSLSRISLLSYRVSCSLMIGPF